jgi:hypothetical protein
LVICWLIASISVWIATVTWSDSSIVTSGNQSLPSSVDFFLCTWFLGESFILE